MTLTYDLNLHPGPAVVMTHTRAKGADKKSLCSEDRVETDGRSEPIALRSWLTLSLMSLLVSCDVLRRSVFLQCFDTVGWVSGRASGPYKLE